MTRMKAWTTLICAWALVLATASPILAQGGGASSTGSISGQVVDGNGDVLPGVSVTATSPAQIGALTAITNEEGIYRFPSVPPGEYKLEFALAGFSKFVREGIRVTLGFNSAVNIKLGVATLEETVTVTGESPVVDTSATRLQTNYDQQTLASLPNARDMWSLLGATPSVTLARVDVGGSTAGTQTNYFAYGYFGQNRPLIEGINTTEGTSAAGFYLDYGSFEEVFIGAAANSAEMPNPGVLTQFVSKSGGNRLVGEPLLRLRERGHSGHEPAGRSDHSCARRDDPAGRQSPGELTSNFNVGRRRPARQRQAVGVLRLPESAELRGRAAGRQHSSTARRSTRSCSTTRARARIS